MATIVIPKRSARLNSRDTSMKISPVRKLRPRKTSAKDSQTADVNVINKRLYVTTKNSSNKTDKNTESIKTIMSETFNKGKKKTSETASRTRLNKITELEKFDKDKKKTYKNTLLTEPNKMTELEKSEKSDKDKKKTYKNTLLMEPNKITKLEKPEKFNKNKKKTYENTSLTRPNKITKLEKPEKFDKNKKKTYKNTLLTEPNKIMKSEKCDRHKKFTEKEKIHIHNTRSRRQMSLKESFSRQTKAKAPVSHSHQDKQEDNGNVKLLQQHLTPQRWNSVVVLQDLIDKKVPIYNTVEASEESTSNKNDIYDFKFDANDTKERLTRKKRKRNINKTKGKIIKRTVQKRAIYKKAAVQSKTTKNEKCDTNSKIVRNNLSLVPMVMPLVMESGKEDIPEKTEKLIMNPDQTVKETTVIHNISAEKIKKHDITKPRIISIENADNIIITKSFNNSEDSQPFRSANILGNKTIVQLQKTVNCSLLTKSWSPIWKTVDTFDPGSPWRPPAYPTLSYPKHFAQSTPNMGKIDSTTHKKNIIHVKDDSHNCEKLINVSDAKLKNIEWSIQSTDKISHIKKKSNLQTRKFGTEITNIENFSNSSTAQGIVETVEEKPMQQMEKELDILPVITVSESSVDIIANKENTSSNYMTPKLLRRKKLKKRHLSNFPEYKTSEIKGNTQKENADPQPGPSGIKRPRIFNEKKMLSELDLNKPENTRIKMEYNILDDVHSMPINNNETKKIVKSTTDLQNNFGFCDEESNCDISVIENKFPNNSVQVKAQPMYIKKPAVRPARLLLRDIKNCLIQKKDDHTNKKQTIDQSNIVESKPLVVEKDKNIVEVINFSDTFDVLSESEKLSNCETEIPLFIDLEPSHFLQPPQHSYKRKRTMTFGFQENSEEEEEEVQDIKTHSKRKRVTKLEKENRKRLDEWIKNVNSTFQEIDNYDLLIE